MKKLSFLLSVCLLFSLSMFHPSADAACGGVTVIDNDSLTDSNGYSGSWVYQSGQGSSFNSDHRYLASPPASGFVYYGWYTTPCENKARIGVYIWNANFTNTSADYRGFNRDSSGSLYRSFSGVLNQRYAAGGWNYIGESTKGISQLELLVFKEHKGGTGADAIKFTYQ
ncbi:hypothetical protein LS684_08820 [Cytobacillus spongiae]|uniref:hypothetical protein n=1 Tax=Cytobacillus spongiae TaxID=2901381 RepID=UPI001F1E52FC|nr:hypothetical protein [Cytobacillus spongiae]UII57517.1 hypothetical protein LS684_08820 [Cytobacillus spongiae]